MISAKPVSGQPGMGHWVAIHYTFTCARKRRKRWEIEVRHDSLQVGDSLGNIERSSSHEKDKLHPALSDSDLSSVWLLCAAASPVWTGLADINLNLDSPHIGCSLPRQLRGNGCAVYTPATICAARSLLSSRNESQKSADAGVDMVPFQTGSFDGTCEGIGRQVLANMMMARLYQFGEFFQ
jgi:hypothetical protein